MPEDVRTYLDKLENAIDLTWEREKLQEWRRVLAFEPVDNRFVAHESAGGTEPGEWPAVGVNEAIATPDRMLLQQLREVYRGACRRTRQIPNIRCNYGTGILPSLFGAEVFWMDDELNTLPTTRPLEGDDPIGKLLEAGVPELTNGFGARVFETAEYFKEELRPYLKTREVVRICHPDLQGPVDAVELLLGSGMFLAFYDRPEELKGLLELVTETYVRLLRRWLDIVPPQDGGEHMAHWGSLYKGQVMLRDDSVVNLSPEMYAEFVKPYDERVLAEFGGGAIHFCGKADHCIDKMTDSQHLTAINMSQPEKNDMRKVYEATVKKGVVLNVPAADDALAGLDLTRGVVLQ